MPDERVHLLQELAGNAWPAPVVQVVGGWRFRFGHGISRRTDSVLANDDDGRLPVADKVALAEAFYARRRVPARFQLSPADRPADLDRALADRGYRDEGAILVQVAPLAGVLRGGGRPWVAVRLAAAPTAGWLSTWSRVDRSGTLGLGATASGILERIGPPAVYATASLDGRPAAVGRAVAERGWAGIFGMATLPEARRRGAAAAVLGALAGWAAEQGAADLYLQVEPGNPAALALYGRVGFRTLYRYHYRTLDRGG
jgi:N-acetylglutamate synthase